MQFGTSCFNGTLFRTNLRRFWPLAGLYFLLWFLALPGWTLGRQGSLSYGGSDVAMRLAYCASGWGCVVAFVFSCAFAMAVFSYLFRHSSAVAFHALPLNRHALFVTNYISGACLGLLPLLAVFALMFPTMAAAGQWAPGLLLQWLLLQAGYLICFYSFAVFLAMFTGNLLALPVLYLILSVLARGVTALLDSLFATFVYGYAGIGWLSTAGSLLSPPVMLVTSVQAVPFYLPDYTVGAVSLIGQIWGAIYAGAGVVLAVIAYFLYRRRAVETAGDVVAVRAVRPVFRVGVALCTGLAGGSVLYPLLCGEKGGSVWPLVLFTVLFCVLGYYVAVMFLQKSLRVFSLRTLRGAAVCAGILAALILMMKFDLFGFEAHVPAASEVASVTISGYSSPSICQTDSLTLTDPDAVADAVDLHRLLVRNKSAVETAVREFPENGGYTTQTRSVSLPAGQEVSADISVQTSALESLTFTYTLNNGGTMTRTYSLVITQEDLSTGGSAASLLQNLVSRTERYANILSAEGVGVDGFSPDTYELTDADVTLCDVASDGQSYTAQSVTLNQQDREALLAAVQQDLAAGQICTNYLLSDLDFLKNVYTPDTIYLQFRSPTRSADGSYNYVYLYLTPETNSTATLRCLKTLGYLDSQSLLTGEQAACIDALETGGVKGG